MQLKLMDQRHKNQAWSRQMLVSLGLGPQDAIPVSDPKFLARLCEELRLDCANKPWVLNSASELILREFAGDTVQEKTLAALLTWLKILDQLHKQIFQMGKARALLLLSQVTKRTVALIKDQHSPQAMSKDELYRRVILPCMNKKEHDTALAA